MADTNFTRREVSIVPADQFVAAALEAHKDTMAGVARMVLLPGMEGLVPALSGAPEGTDLAAMVREWRHSHPAPTPVPDAENMLLELVRGYLAQGTDAHSLRQGLEQMRDDYTAAA